jgi:hypothetical protein
VSQSLGHNNIKITADKYTRYLPDEQTKLDQSKINVLSRHLFEGSHGHPVGHPGNKIKPKKPKGKASRYSSYK